MTCTIIKTTGFYFSNLATMAVDRVIFKFPACADILTTKVYVDVSEKELKRELEKQLTGKCILVNDIKLSPDVIVTDVYVGATKQNLYNAGSSSSPVLVTRLCIVS